MKSCSSYSCSCAAVTSCPAADALRLARARRRSDRRRSAVPATRRNSSCVACSSRSAIASSRSALSVMPSSSRSFCSNLLASESEGGLRARREVGFEVIEYRLDGGRGLGGRVCKVAEEVQVVEVANARGRSTSMNLSVPRRLSSPTLTKMPGRVLDVVAGRLHQGAAPAAASTGRGGRARLPGRRRTAPGPPGSCEQVGVELGIALPGADLFELEQA